MSNLSTFYKPAITRADLGLGTANNVTFASIQNTPIGNTTPAAGTFTTLTANNGTLTASAPVLDLAQTWNASGTTFTALRVNVTNTASAAASLLADLQVGGTSQFSVTRSGQLNLTAGSETAPAIKFPSSSLGIYSRGAGEMTFTDGLEPQWRYVSNALYFNSDFLLGWGSSNASPVSVDTLLRRDAAGTIAQYNGTNAQAFNIYNTFTSTTNHERGFLRWSSNNFEIGTEAGSGGGSSREVRIVAGAATYRFATNNLAVFPGSLTLGQLSGLFWFGRGRIQANADGVFSMEVNAGGNFNRLQFGGTTSSFPALKRDSTTLQVRLADDSAFGALEALSFTTANSRIVCDDTNSVLHVGNTPRISLYGGNATYLALGNAHDLRWSNTGRSDQSTSFNISLARDADGILAQRAGATAQTWRIYNTVSGTGNVNFDRVNFRWASNEFIIDAEAGGTGTLRGIKIGSATSSLLGFFGATPVVQQAAVADATDAASTQDRLNDLLARLRTLGLIAT